MTKDELAAWQRKLERLEPALTDAIRQWLERVVNTLPLDLVVEVLRTLTAQPLLDAIRRAGPPPIDLFPAASLEGKDVVDELARAPRVNLAFNMRDPRFQSAVEQEGARRIVQVTEETRQAVRDIVNYAYRRQMHPYAFAPMVRDAVGLDTRRSVALLNYTAGQLQAGVRQDVLEKRAARYAKTLRTQRAKTIARTETIRGAMIGRLAGFQQAADAGLVPRDRAFLEWNAIQDDPAEVCFQLDGRRAPLAEGSIDGFVPPVHPNCRCSLDMIVV